MAGKGMRRQPRMLTPEQKWEMNLEVISGEITQADAARKWDVDVSTVIKVRTDIKNAALAHLASAKSGRPPKADPELEALRAENARLTQAIKELAVELTLLRGKWRSG